MIKKIQFLIIVIGVLMIIGKNAFSEWKGCIYDYAITGEETYIPVIIGKFCGPGAPTELVIEKLNLSTGVYETVGVLHNPPRFGIEAVSFPANIAILDNDGPGLSFDVVSLFTMKVIGKITVDVSPGTDMDAFPPTLKVSPDGSRIYVNGEIFDGHTYKVINKNTQFYENFTFSPDSKLIYHIDYIDVANNKTIPQIDVFDAYTGNIVSKIDSRKFLNAYPTLPIDLSNKHPNPGYPFIEKVVNGEFVPVVVHTPPNFIGYMYDIKTEAVSPTVTVLGYSPMLSDNGKWWIVEPHEVVLDRTSAISAINYLGKVDVYEVATGNKVAEMNITLPAYPLGVMGPYSTNGKTVTQYSTGAIISWANDHTFIYNTTQKLIYFDIKQNKIIKELPIIRPWEKPGWKPEVGK